MLQGLQETILENVIQTQMEVGPSKRRLRSSAATRTFELEVKTDLTGYNAFIAFYETTLKFGTDKFDWINPSTNIASSNCYIESPTYEWFTAKNVSIKFRLLIRPY
jgi:hypothetical protein